MWVYNENPGTGEWIASFGYSTKDEAIEAGRAFHIERTKEIKAPKARWDARAERFSVGYVLAYDPWVNVDRLLKGLKEDAIQFAGGVALEWLENLKDGEKAVLGARLEGVVREWLQEIDQEPSFCVLDQISEHKIEINVAPARVYKLDRLPELAAAQVQNGSKEEGKSK